MDLGADSNLSLEFIPTHILPFEPSLISDLLTEWIFSVLDLSWNYSCSYEPIQPIPGNCPRPYS